MRESLSSQEIRRMVGESYKLSSKIFCNNSLLISYYSMDVWMLGLRSTC